MSRLQQLVYALDPWVQVARLQAENDNLRVTNEWLKEKDANNVLDYSIKNKALREALETLQICNAPRQAVGVACPVCYRVITTTLASVRGDA